MVGAGAATVEPEQVSALAFQLAQLATDAKWREQLRAAGLKRARWFDWRLAASQTLQVYERAVARARSRVQGADAQFTGAFRDGSSELREGVEAR